MKRLILEVSLKPFRDLSSDGLVMTVREIMRQWQGLIREAEEISFLLWTADGSEILDYKGQADEAIEWARYIGVANPKEEHAGDPDKRTVVSSAHLYSEAPARITYADLLQIVETFHKMGKELSGKTVTIGATFDPGPEFAKSSFKYIRHPEICVDAPMGKGSWVSCGAVLNGDSETYAGYPQGIPEGTTFGEFFGRQASHFLKDMGFDYIWFSNGFGYALNAWKVTGELFDGQQFYPEHVEKNRSSILGFWKDFRRECPAFRIETRGSNFSAGMDMSSGGCPLYEIYNGGFDMVAPPNSPWAAMDGDYGLEVVGYLSRIAMLPPNEEITFRYYINDPWFLNSPWIDRYGREPHDIYLPLALARLDAAGSVTPVSNISFLTLDNSYGELVEQCAQEVTPHFLEALKNGPEEPGLITWIYPFSEYHELTFGHKPDLEKVFFGDWFMRGAVNHGFPISSVISSDNFLQAWKSRSEVFKRSILFSLVPEAGSPLEVALLSAAREGFQVLLYGPLERASELLREALNLRCVTSLGGEFEMRSQLASDHLDAGELPSRFLHQSALCGGGINTISIDPDLEHWRELASVCQEGEERSYAVLAQFPGGGRLGWLRGTFCASINEAKLPVPHLESEWLHVERWLRLMLSEFGYSFQVQKPTTQTRDPLFAAAIKRNAFYFSGYQPSTLAEWRLRFPEGAPLMIGCDTWLEDGHALYKMPRAWHRECRCFIKQSTAGAVSCLEQFPGEVGLRRRIAIKGLVNATVRFYPEPNSSQLRLVVNDPWPHGGASMLYSTSSDGRSVEVEGITGNLLISW